MTPHRWRQIEALYHEAREREPHQRAAFLAEACNGDAELRDRVEQMLAESSAGDHMLDRPAARLLEPDAGPTLPAGTQLGRYRIECVLGTGGMGKVYRALDTRLNRAVAIKTSREQFTERFEEEARAISALSHPNVCTLHDVGPNYLVMELVEGETLANVIRRGPVPMAEALRYASQIADALDAAHERGIVHCDLKPGNIVVKADGTVKVLDFGLAKINRPGADASAPPTGAGIVMGTPAYMSPEQARGGNVDKRADTWSFGVLLYEMLTGRKPFEAATAKDVSAVLNKEIDFEAIPAKARQLVRLCLQRDPNKRLRHVADMDLWLEERAETPQARKPALLWPAAAALIALSVVAFYVGRTGSPQRNGEVARLLIPQPEGMALTDSYSVSPDGRKLAFIAKRGGLFELWIRSLDTFEAHPLPAAKGVRVGHGALIWSPDSRWIVYTAEGNLNKADISGGPAQVIAKMPSTPGPGFWTSHGRIVFGGLYPAGISQIPAQGGTVTQVTAPTDGDSTHDLPSLLPDGVHFVYTRRGQAQAAAYIGSLTSGAQDQSRTPLLTDADAAAYVPRAGQNDGYLLFVRKGDLVAQRFDPVRRQLVGTPLPVAQEVSQTGVFTENNLRPAPGFAVSAGGVLAYRSELRDVSQITIADRRGNIVDKVGEPGVHLMLAFGPDGKSLTAVRQEPGPAGWDLWRHELTGARRGARWSEPSSQGMPVWSPDSSRIAYSNVAQPRGKFEVYEKTVQSSGPGRLLYSAEGHVAMQPSGWSPKGLHLLLDANLGKAVWVYSFETKKARLLIPDATLGTFSPDGHWVTYGSGKSGKNEIYVRPFHPAADPSELPEWMVSQGGAFWTPYWIGNEILYRHPSGDVMSVKVAASGGPKNPVVQAQKPELLFKADPRTAVGNTNHNWSVSPDGQRFALLFPVTNPDATAYKIVLNWTAGLSFKN